MNAILTSMEAALLRSMGLSEPRIEAINNGRLEYRAVIVRPTGRTIEALGNSSEDATRKVIRIAMSK